MQEFRHHLALVPRPKPEHPLPEKYWTGMPRLELGPGHDFIHNRIQQELAVERGRVEQFFVNMRCAASIAAWEEDQPFARMRSA